MEQPTAGSDPIFTAGYESGRTGAPDTENPYGINSAEAEQWLEGWGEGAVKRAVVNAKPDADTPADG